MGGRVGALVTGLLCVDLPGKVAIRKEDLQKYHNRDTWFQLQHVDADSEVQGPGDTRRGGRLHLLFSGDPGLSFRSSPSPSPGHAWNAGASAEPGLP
ncbi:hypothetical protein J1605_009319 [Eschrichtius robustus]|uniref:Uncharacterized protein n=1 Tax=Eschrichtius robustus TaxID=9764 RepID=A0AB34GS00_ESCRO|nr:hypothetical protein J1605_009319 [Eschrichtius robustus]